MAAKKRTKGPKVVKPKADPEIVKHTLPLETDTVVQVVPVKGVVPVVVVHPETKSVYIAPAPAAKPIDKPLTWMEYLFGK